MRRNTESAALSELAPFTGIPDAAARAPTVSAVTRDGSPACATDQTASAFLLDPSALDLSSPNIDPNKLAWLPPIEQYRWHSKHNPVYQSYWNWYARPETMLPNGLMAKYRERVEVTGKEGREPSIATDLLLVHDGVGKERWAVLREVQRVEELGWKEKPRPFCGEAANLFGVLRERHQRRYRDIIWLDKLWSRCVAFEAENGIVDEERVKQRFKRFPFGVFPTLAERDEAEKRAEEEEK